MNTTTSQTTMWLTRWRCAWHVTHLMKVCMTRLMKVCMTTHLMKVCMTCDSLDEGVHDCIMSWPVPLVWDNVVHSLTEKIRYNLSPGVKYLVFRIHPDPLHLAGSGSTSGNVDPDPGSKKNLVGDIVAYSFTEKKVHIILVQGQNIFFFFLSYICIYVKNFIL